LIKINGKYDTSIKGMGLDTTVSKIENTLLKQTRVGKNIPTVAEQIQGEVVKFANEAMTILRQAGMTILLEGREQTLNYMETPHKFRLVLSDQSLIGKRRAAQRLMAEALDRIENNDGKELDIAQILDEVLNSMAAEDLATDEGCCAMPAFLTAK
jgi:ribosomal protein S7